MSQRTEIKEGMRAILVDWLIQVHNRFRLLQETLYITISIVDRFLSVSGLNCKFWFLNVGALLFASWVWCFLGITAFMFTRAWNQSRFSFKIEEQFSNKQRLIWKGAIKSCKDFNIFYLCLSMMQTLKFKQKTKLAKILRIIYTRANDEPWKSIKQNGSKPSNHNPLTCPCELEVEVCKDDKQQQNTK